MKLVNATDVANAALMEVGMEPTIAGRILTFPDSADSYMAYRAAVLGGLAEFGPNRKCRCYPCSKARRLSCITLADALMGRTCGNS